jgi:hypothetical protein
LSACLLMTQSGHAPKFGHCVLDYRSETVSFKPKCLVPSRKV